MSFEIIHDTVAKLVFEKAGVEMRSRRKVEREIRERYEAFLKRRSRLSKEDVDYFLPWMPHVNISQEQADFIQNEVKVLAAKRKRSIWTIAIALGVLTCTSVISVWQWKVAETKKQEADYAGAVVIKAYDSLENMEDVLKQYKDSLTSVLKTVNELYVSQNDTALSSKINNLIYGAEHLSPEMLETGTGIFEEDFSVRSATLQYMLDHKTNDSVFVRKRIQLGIEKFNDTKGTVNNLYFLNRVNPELLRNYRQDLIRYLDVVDRAPGRNQAKALAKSIRTKL